MWFSGNYTELNMTMNQARSASHSGQCDEDVEILVKILRPQLTKLQPNSIRKELAEYGAWNHTELSDDAQNLRRLVWIAAGQIVEEHFSKEA